MPPPKTWYDRKEKSLNCRIQKSKRQNGTNASSLQTGTGQCHLRIISNCEACFFRNIFKGILLFAPLFSLLYHGVGGWGGNGKSFCFVLIICSGPNLSRVSAVPKTVRSNTQISGRTNKLCTTLLACLSVCVCVIKASS